MKTIKYMIMALAMIAIIGVGIGIGTVSAAPEGGSNFVNAGQVPEGSVLVLDVTLKVTNDEDSGLAGYWAIDNYNRHIQVWQVPDGSFYAIARYEGKWQTFAGVPSPGNTGVATSDGSGTFHGGYVATFTGALKADPGLPTSGNIGTFDYGGSEADVLLGTYGNGQTGPTTVFNWLNTYFTGVSNFAQPNWGWTYNYRGQSWNNYGSGNTGDIVI